MEVDLAIVGLGTAGAAVAAAAADSGLSVVGFDRADLDQTGARWCNGVPGWAFDEAGFSRPEAEELHGPEGTPFHLIAGWDGPRVKTGSVMDVDMRLLTRRLLLRAREHGADLRGGTKVTGFDGTILRLDSGPVRARVFVDAAGLTGPALDQRPAPARADLCVAAQEVRAIADSAAADAFFAARGVGAGEIACFTSVAGGYSIVNVRRHGDEVSILTGSVPALGHPSGGALLDQFVAANPWIGALRFGGRRALPLGLPHACVGAGNVVRIGDSAGMVHAAHGSGIAQQLLAARLLATTLKGGGTASDFNVAWQRRYGGVLGGADVFRRFSQTLSRPELEALIRGGVMSPAAMADTLVQRPVRPDLATLAGAGIRLARLPRIARRMVPVVVRMKAMELHYRRYPSDATRIASWTALRDRIAG